MWTDPPWILLLGWLGGGLRCGGGQTHQLQCGGVVAFEARKHYLIVRFSTLLEFIFILCISGELKLLLFAMFCSFLA